MYDNNNKTRGCTVGILAFALLMVLFMFLGAGMLRWIGSLLDEAIEALNNIYYLDDGSFIYWSPTDSNTTDEAPHDEG